LKVNELFLLSSNLKATDGSSEKFLKNSKKKFKEIAMVSNFYDYKITKNCYCKK